LIQYGEVYRYASLFLNPGFVNYRKGNNMKLLIIDGNSIINRAFYGIRILSTAGGEYTNAVYGFLSTYFKLMEEESPDGVCVCFDLKAPTFRHLEYADYKAGRRPMPEELVSQLPLLKEVLDTMGVTRCELAGFEADDLLGTIARLGEEHGDEMIIVTGDRDSLQLTTEHTKVKIVTSKEGKTITTDHTPDVILEKYGVTPAGLIEVKALMGDKSDNIPGVAGIGEKTALELIKNYKSVEAIYADLDGLDVKSGIREKLRKDRDAAFMSLRLATIDRFAPVEYCNTCMKLKTADEGALYRLFTRLEFKAFIKKLGLKPAAPVPVQAEPVDTAAKEVILRRVENEDDADMLCAYVKNRLVSVLIDEEEQYLAVCASGGETDIVYIAVAADLAYPVWEKLLRTIGRGDVRKICHDAKPLYLKMRRKEMEFQSVVFDTAVAAYLLDPVASGYGLGTLAKRYLDEDLPDPVHEDPAAFSPLVDQEAAIASLTAYVRANARLGGVMPQLLRTQGMDTLYYEIELPLSEVLADMQYLGVKVDLNALCAFSDELLEEIGALEKKIYALAGMEFNINSPKQLGELLFDVMDLPFKKKTKSGYSTDIDILQKLKEYHPIIPEIIEYRSLTKLRSTYAEGLKKYVSSADGRIHSTFHQLVTATGRISSADPNLQNIPVRTARGAQLRRMIVSEPGYTLVDADYSQIELRVLAHIADDTSLKEAFASGGDIHRATAASVEGVAPEDVTPEMRSRAKAVNFGLVYGMSEFSLAESIGISRAEAKRYIENYFSKYPGVKRYMEEIKETAKAQGYVTTLMGRRRALPELASSNHNIRAFGERVALNTPIQGTAADIIKAAMVRVHRRLKAEGLKSRLILQVHDELIVETAKEEKDIVLTLVEEEMRSAMELSVALVADAASGDTWFDAKK